MSDSSRSKPHPEGELVAADDRAIGRAFRWSAVAVLTLAAAAGIAYGAVRLVERLNRPPRVVQGSAVLPQQRARPTVEAPTLPLANVTLEAGVDFVHHNGAQGEKLLPETMGGGGAFFDFDNDGDQDLLLINSQEWPDRPAADQTSPTMALYRNDGLGHFQGATVESGLDQSLYGMGCAVGDYDNDGWADLFVTAVGLNRLFHNEQGKFVEVTAEAGVGGVEDQWSSGSAWLDYDNDADLDLFVCNYIRWSKEIDAAQDFRLVGVGRAYGPPAAFEGAFSYLYRNEGQGKFTDVSAAAGIKIENPNTGVPMGKSLGLAPVDLDSDGWIDLIVANDTVQNFVFRNRGDGGFDEIGALAGIAFDGAGNARGAMGLDSGDVRNNGRLCVTIGNFANEMTAYYVSLEDPLQFVDAALASGLGPQTRLNLTFGVFFLDVDLDGRLDLLSANGHLENDINKVQESQHYAQPPQLFWNAGPGQSAEFLRMTAEHCGSAFGQPMVGRGSAFADIDGDGDLDVLITGNGGQPRLLRNDQALGHHWLRLKLVGGKCNRDAIGAWVEVQAGGVTQRRQVMPTRGYLSQSELTLTFGLGKADKLDKVLIRWPDGTEQELQDVPLDKEHRVEQPAS